MESTKETKPTEPVVEQQEEEKKPLTEEEKREKTKESLQRWIDQMEPRVQSTVERRQIDQLKQMIPLYDKHAFWDSQPVPHNVSVTAVRISVVHLIVGRS